MTGKTVKMTGKKTAKTLAMSILMSFLALAGPAFGQLGPPVAYHPEWHRGPFLNLRDAATVATRYAGAVTLANARALSTAAADFDEDGMPDLVAGFETRTGAGAVAIHRGNMDALWPYGALRGIDPPAFHRDVRVFALPEPPDFLAAGDFDADGVATGISSRRTPGVRRSGSSRGTATAVLPKPSASHFRVALRP